MHSKFLQQNVQNAANRHNILYVKILHYITPIKAVCQVRRLKFCYQFVKIVKSNKHLVIFFVKCNILNVKIDKSKQ